ncbi:hypothetical protein SBADM41S_07029 [Streptomyces badius]
MPPVPDARAGRAAAGSPSRRARRPVGGTGCCGSTGTPWGGTVGPSCGRPPPWAFSAAVTTDPSEGAAGAPDGAEARARAWRCGCCSRTVFPASAAFPAFPVFPGTVFRAASAGLGRPRRRPEPSPCWAGISSGACCSSGAAGPRRARRRPVGSATGRSSATGTEAAGAPGATPSADVPSPALSGVPTGLSRNASVEDLRARRLLLLVTPGAPTPSGDDEDIGAAVSGDRPLASGSGGAIVPDAAPMGTSRTYALPLIPGISCVWRTPPWAWTMPRTIGSCTGSPPANGPRTSMRTTSPRWAAATTTVEST